MNEDIITPTEAARIYRRITRHRRAPEVIVEDVLTFRHLGYFDCSGSSPTLIGIRRRRWEYFVSMRLLLRGSRRIFGNYEGG